MRPCKQGWAGCEVLPGLRLHGPIFCQGPVEISYARQELIPPEYTMGLTEGSLTQHVAKRCRNSLWPLSQQG